MEISDNKSRVVQHASGLDQISGSSTQLHLLLSPLGGREDVPALLAASDFFVFPTSHENCSSVLLKAMHAGHCLDNGRSRQFRTRR